MKGSRMILLVAVMLLASGGFLTIRKQVESNEILDAVFGTLYWLTLIGFIAYCWWNVRKTMREMAERDERQEASFNDSMANIEKQNADWLKAQEDEGEEWKR